MNTRVATPVSVSSKRKARFWAAGLAALPLVAGYVCFSLPAEAANGSQVTIGKVDQTVAIKDTTTGRTYNVFLEAREGSTAGQGDTTLLVVNSPANACSVHGPSPSTLSGSAFDYNSGASDYAFECGTAYGQAVSINGCTANIQMHGFVHQDTPLTAYLGTTTIDATVTKSLGVYRVSLRITNPRGDVRISGNLPAGAYRNWPSCP